VHIRRQSGVLEGEAGATELVPEASRISDADRRGHCAPQARQCAVVCGTNSWQAVARCALPGLPDKPGDR